MAQELGINKMETFTDPRDGKTYKIVTIGKQTWMAENLNYEAECSKSYDNNPANSQKYGRLYDWKTAMNICPPGWHLPSDREWLNLKDLSKYVGRELKAKYGWVDWVSWRKNWVVTWGEKENAANGEDTYGFSALPGGEYSGGKFNGDWDGNWWSASEYDSYDAYYRYMLYHNEYADSHRSSKGYLFSVRCLKD